MCDAAIAEARNRVYGLFAQWPLRWRGLGERLECLRGRPWLYGLQLCGEGDERGLASGSGDELDADRDVVGVASGWERDGGPADEVPRRREWDQA